MFITAGETGGKKSPLTPEGVENEKKITAFLHQRAQEGAEQNWKKHSGHTAIWFFTAGYRDRLGCRFLLTIGMSKDLR